MCSSWKQPGQYDVRSSLVVLLGIGEYDGMQDLSGVRKDYENLIHVFYKHFGYSVVFYDIENKLHCCNKNPTHCSSELIKQEKLNTNEFKLKWSDDDVYDFIDEIIPIISFDNHD